MNSCHCFRMCLRKYSVTECIETCRKTGTSRYNRSCITTHLTQVYMVYSVMLVKWVCVFEIKKSWYCYHCCCVQQCMFNVGLTVLGIRQSIARIVGCRVYRGSVLFLVQMSFSFISNSLPFPVMHL